MSVNYKEPSEEELEFVYTLINWGHTVDEIVALYTWTDYPKRNRRFIANRAREMNAIARVLDKQIAALNDRQKGQEG